MEEQLRGPHPYLSGNFAPIERCRPLTRCEYTGNIPIDFAGGQYVRNGGNPLTNEDLGRDTHWFDGDGMLSGVLFRRTGDQGSEVVPEFVNQYILTDVYMNAKGNENLKRPILPSIATLLSASVVRISLVISRTVMLVLLSRLPGSKKRMKKISVANTAMVYHDGRALATCESGPPMRVHLPSLDTIGWFSGRGAENEPEYDPRPGFGGSGPLSFLKEWTTGHPRVDPATKELIAFHSVPIEPYAYYSIVPSGSASSMSKTKQPPARFDMPVPGMRSPKMMHDFGVSAKHTIIMDLPLSLNPMNSLKGKPVVEYDPTEPSRFGVFPRYEPRKIQWFETNPCVIFHTANAWETQTQKETCVHLLACRLTSASVVYSAGALQPPVPKPVPLEYTEEEQCRLYYLEFPLAADGTNEKPKIRNQWALSKVPFEFPTMSADHAMGEGRYFYGCSTGSDQYTPALGKAAKIDYIAKIDATTLIQRGLANPPEPVKGCVDTRSVDEIVESNDAEDPIKMFKMPDGWYAQEPRFVPRTHASAEDDGWIVSYMFDESQLDEAGNCGEDAVSELWIIDARDMREVVARVKLPQRVPYGLHGSWFPEEELSQQRPFEGTRQSSLMSTKGEQKPPSMWSIVRDRLEKAIG